MITKLDVSNPSITKQILSVQIPAYMVEANLIGFYDIPPLKDTVQSVQNCGETFYGFFDQGSLTGVISYRRQGEILNIIRMVIHPDHFRKGIARALLIHIQTVEKDVKTIIVCTGAQNTPAKELYLRDGFVCVGDMEVEPGVAITKFEKRSTQE